MRTIQRISCCVLFVATSMKFVSTVISQDVFERPVTKGPSQWALLIGVERYTKATPLSFTCNDVERLTDTLLKRNGLSRENILDITDRRIDDEFKPKKSSLLRALPEFLNMPQEQDSIIVYFSGHGFRDKEGKLYLAPLDCDPEDPTSTCIPVSWFREQIAACKAKFKLLVLDACHAGSEKGEQTASVDSNSIGAQFGELERVVTIASSKANEKSQIWAAKEQSLFSYWLDQALKGHADRDGNGNVDIDELYEYVSQRVTKTAELRFQRPQTPVRIIRAGVEGIPPVVQLRPQELKTVLADIAEQVSYALEEKQIAKVGVLEFTGKLQQVEGPGAGMGMLGKFCAEQVERKLLDQGAGKFSVIERRRLEESLRRAKFELASLSSEEGLKSLTKQVPGLTVIVVGSLERQGRFMNLQCKLQSTEDESDLGVRVGGTIALNESEYAMLGRSYVVRTQDRHYREYPDAGSSPTTQLIDRLDEQTEKPQSHPYYNKNFPFRVELYINDQIRLGELQGNDYLVPVTKGEKYELRITSKLNEPIMLKLLVDGLNTLPQKEQNTKGVVVETWGTYVHLDDALPWILDPSRPEIQEQRRQGKEQEWRVGGFTTAIGENGNWKQFEIVDVADSLAARQNFGDQIGQITAVFFKTVAADSGDRGGGPGTRAGQDEAVEIQEKRGLKLGTQLGTITIRYVYKEALKRATE